MKKIFLFTMLLFSIFFITACDGMNTPTKRTEEYLSKYSNLDDAVKEDIDLMVETEKFNAEASALYKRVLEKQLGDLKYEILSEEINGNDAIVTAKIKVYDLVKVKKESDEYYKTNNDEFMNNGVLDNEKFTKYQLEHMLDYNEKIEYTIKINVTKVDDTWIVEDVNNEVKQKIYGLYNY